MKEKKIDIVYSDQVSEIISNPPRKIVRLGTFVISIVFIILLVLSWLIKYPDIIPAPVEITTTFPPATLVSKITGPIIKLYVQNGQKVSKNTLLAVMQTAASIEEYKTLRTVTDSLKDPTKINPQDLLPLTRLGEIQPFYASFLRAVTDYNTYVKNDIYGYRIKSVNEEISALNDHIRRLRTKERLLEENLELELKKYGRDSLLFNNKVISESAWEASRQAWNTSRLSLQEVMLEESSQTIVLAQKKQMLQDYTILREEEREKLASMLHETWQNLAAEMNIWENKYLLISPVDGVVTFTRYWSENQSVVADEPVLTVVPEDTGDYIGRIRLSMQRSGKVTIGLNVNIKLSGYPYLEYGMVRGIIISKSLVPSGDSYMIEVELPDGLTTLYGKQLGFTQNMQGVAEVVTDDLRLLQKIVNPLRHLISKNIN